MENQKKTPINDWIRSLKPKASSRLLNVLTNSKYHKNGIPFKYVEDIGKKEFFKLNNAGVKTWAEVVEHYPPAEFNLIGEVTPSTL